MQAVRTNRSLLDTPDPIAPSAKEMGEALRTALTTAATGYAAAHAQGLALLGADSLWQKLPPTKQANLLAAAGVQVRSTPACGTDEELLAALDVCPLATWRAHTDALATQFANAHAAAVKELEPKARRVSLASATIRNTAELDAWLVKARASIELSLKDGPVIL